MKTIFKATTLVGELVAFEADPIVGLKRTVQPRCSAEVRVLWDNDSGYVIFERRAILSGVEGDVPGWLPQPEPLLLFKHHKKFEAVRLAVALASTFEQQLELLFRARSVEFARLVGHPSARNAAAPSAAE